MVFVTSLLEPEAQRSKVGMLINDLHHLGYHVKSDKLYEAYEVPNNLSEMMYDNINRAKKVIIVLPELDKDKMDSLIHELGNEYRDIIAGIYEKGNKYILLILTHQYFDIESKGFKGREIININLSEPAPNRYIRLLKCLFH